MSGINWAAEGGLQGEHLEAFIATCLCRRYNPEARQTRPASGDGGVDVIRETPEGLYIWQVKQHVAPLTSDQKTKVKKSWKRFWTEYVDKGRTILRYELVTPWTPTDGFLEWFRGVTADAEFPTYWHGATFVDGLAADYPAIFDRFVKGDDVLDQKVLAKALIAASPVETAGSIGSMLSAIRTREVALQDLRDLASDHYTVDYAIKTLPPGQTLDPRQLTGGIHYRVENVGNNRWTVESVVPTTEQSLELDPINFKTTFTAEPGSADEAALKDWFYWGKPPPESGLPAVTQTTGGPLADPEPLEGRVSFLAVKDEQRSYPRLVWRSVDLPTADFVAFDVQEVTRGLHGGGLRLVARSESGMMRLETRFGSTLAESSFELKIDSTGGQDPAAVASELGIVDQLAAAESNELITEPDTVMAVFRADAIPDSFPFLRQVALDLAALQPYASTPIRMPDVTKMDDEDVRHLRQLGQVYSGQPIVRTWDSCEVVVDDPERFLAPEFSMGAIARLDSEITLSYCDPPVVLNQPMVHVLSTPTVANPDDVQAGKAIRLVPGADNRYVISLPAEEPAEEPAEADETPTTQ